MVEEVESRNRFLVGRMFVCEGIVSRWKKKNQGEGGCFTMAVEVGGRGDGVDVGMGTRTTVRCPFHHGGGRRRNHRAEVGSTRVNF